MIEFQYPWLFLCLPLPLFIMWLAPAYKEKKSSVKVPYFSLLVGVTGQKPNKGAVVLTRTILQKLLLLIAWSCLVISIAKPELVGPPITYEKSARDLMVAVDLSGSMSVKDFKTKDGKIVDRLTAVKSVLVDFVKGRQGDRIGLILFGDAPYLQAPFTADMSTWLTLLDEAQIGMAGQSTAFGDAIGLSISIFEQSQTKNRVLIVLTDGNDTASKVPPIEAAKVAASREIKIYSIAIGDPDSADEEKMDLKVLKSISESTGGQYFQALNREELKGVYQQIDKLEPQKFDSLTYRVKTSVHQYPMILFGLLYLIAFVLVGIRAQRVNIGDNANG